MRALVQRVSQGSVRVGRSVVGSIGAGLVVFVGVGKKDTEEDAPYLVEKMLNLRVFPDELGRFDRSALETGAELLLVSQFTLYGDTRRGRRPSFSDAAPPDQAEPLFNRVVELCIQSGLRVQTGRFQEHMLVELVNDGPVTIWLDSSERHRPRRG